MAFKTTRYAPTPIEALKLAEDVQTLELIIGGGPRWRWCIARHTGWSRTFLARGAEYGDGLPFSSLAGAGEAEPDSLDVPPT